MQIYKRLALKAFEHFGYEIRRKHQQEPETSHLESCLLTLLGRQSNINILQIGANDGSINDPLHKFVKKFSNRVSIILVEPQPLIIKHLEKNYSFHDKKYIFNGAIGPGSKLTLYQISEDVWPELKVPYAKDWPIYRAPTGVTSTNYDHVASWLSHHYKGERALTDMIESVAVDCLDAANLLDRANLFQDLDVLQVDVEGFDDEVIYYCKIERTRPAVINFEWNSISTERLENLNIYLESNGYVVARHGIDALAIHAGEFWRRRQND